MSRRWAAVGAGAGVLVLLAALQPLLLPLPSPVTRAACGRIRGGMTRAEVEAVMGRPAGDYRTRPVVGYTGSGGGVGWAVWSGDEAEAWVHFDGGVARGHFVHECGPAEGGVLGGIAFRAERLKERWVTRAP